MDCKDAKEVIDLYAVGALAPDTTRELEEHMQVCPTCKLEHVAMEETYAMLPLALEGPAPPPSTRRALLARIRRDLKPEATETQWYDFLLHPGFSYSLLALSIFLMAVVGIRQQSRFAGQVAAARDEIDFLKSQNEDTQEQIAIIQSPQTRVMRLAGQSVHPQASGKVFWDPARRVWLVYASQLPAAPPGKAYELWFLTKKNPIKAGMFAADVEGNGFVKVSIPQNIEPLNAAVSLEPEQGVESPTGAIYLVGI